jgi:hypothetical protein
MTNAQKNSPMLKVAGLWQKSSVKGGQYLTGRLGAMKVLVMENRDRQSDDDPSHTLFFVEAGDRRQDGQQRAQDRFGGAGGTFFSPRTPQNASAAQRSGFQGIDCPIIKRRSTTICEAPEWA